MKKVLTAMVVLFAFTAAGMAFASGTFKPPPAAPKEMKQYMTFDLMAMKTAPDAKGKMTLDCYKDGKDMLDIRMKGLKPGEVYTVWAMLGGDNKKGVGNAPYSFKPGKDGEARFIARLDECPAGKWNEVMIVMHKDGNPKNMKMDNLVPTLKSEKMKK